MSTREVTETKIGVLPRFLIFLNFCCFIPSPTLEKKCSLEHTSVAREISGSNFPDTSGSEMALVVS